MRHLYIIICIATFLGWSSSSPLYAQKTKKSSPVFAFGYSTSFNDSVVYLTTVQELPDASLEKGTNFLIDRPRYSSQLRSHLESRYWGHETAVVFFSEKKKKMDKKYQKVLKEQRKKKGIRIVEIPASEFQFQTLNDSKKDTE